MRGDKPPRWSWFYYQAHSFIMRIEQVRSGYIYCTFFFFGGGGVILIKLALEKMF